MDATPEVRRHVAAHLLSVVRAGCYRDLKFAWYCGCREDGMDVFFFSFCHLDELASGGVFQRQVKHCTGCALKQLSLRFVQELVPLVMRVVCVRVCFRQK